MVGKEFNVLLMRPDNKEKIAVGMAVSTVSEINFNFDTELKSRVEVDVADIRRALEPHMTVVNPGWSQHRYDLLVGIDSENRLRLFPIGSTKPVKSMLLSDIGYNPNIDRRIFWLLSAPVYKTSANTVRAIWGVDETGGFQLTEQTRWGAVSDSYLYDSIKYFDGYNISSEYWEKYKYCVLTGAYGTSNTQVDVMNSGSLVDGGPLDRGPVTASKPAGGNGLLELAQNID